MGAFVATWSGDASLRTFQGRFLGGVKVRSRQTGICRIFPRKSRSNVPSSGNRLASIRNSSTSLRWTENFFETETPNNVQEIYFVLQKLCFSTRTELSQWVLGEWPLERCCREICLRRIEMETKFVKDPPLSFCPQRPRANWPSREIRKKLEAWFFSDSCHFKSVFWGGELRGVD